MAGLLVFRSMQDALAAGFQKYDVRPDGYLVRKKINGTWRLALVDLKPKP